MSEKKAKQDRKLKVMTEDADPKKVAEEMAKTISKMYEDRDKKAISAKENLIEQLRIIVDKYRTANGVMSALDTLRTVLGEQAREMTMEEEIGYAKTIASNMALTTQEMLGKASDLEPDVMNTLCDTFYDKEFSEHDGIVLDMVQELMTLQLCQNIGPSANDITDFLSHTDADIEKARNDLKEYCDKNGLSFNELCSPYMADLSTIEW